MEEDNREHQIEEIADIIQGYCKSKAELYNLAKQIYNYCLSKRLINYGKTVIGK